MYFCYRSFQRFLKKDNVALLLNLLRKLSYLTVLFRISRYQYLTYFLDNILIGMESELRVSFIFKILYKKTTICYEIISNVENIEFPFLRNWHPTWHNISGSTDRSLTLHSKVKKKCFYFSKQWSQIF